jgi:hypothetical protein
MSRRWGEGQKRPVKRIEAVEIEAATWKTGLKGGFGFMAMTGLVCLAST